VTTTNVLGLDGITPTAPATAAATATATAEKSNSVL
jgi:hypothetical protein